MVNIRHLFEIYKRGTLTFPLEWAAWEVASETSSSDDGSWIDVSSDEEKDIIINDISDDEMDKMNKGKAKVIEGENPDNENNEKEIHINTKDDREGKSKASVLAM